jgi:hypothetical protein
MRAHPLDTRALDWIGSDGARPPVPATAGTVSVLAGQRNAKAKPAPTSGPPQIAVDVTSQVQATSSRLVLNRRTKVVTGTVTVTDKSATSIPGPIQVTFGGLPAGVSLVRAKNQAGGASFITASTNHLAHKRRLRLAVKFSDPPGLAIHPSISVFSGSFATSRDVFQLSTAPTDPLVLSISAPSGQSLAFLGAKDASGTPTAINAIRLGNADGTSTTILLDGQGRPVEFLTPNGMIETVQWTTSSSIVLTISSPDGGAHASVAVNLATGTVSPAPSTTSSAAPHAVTAHAAGGVVRQATAPSSTNLFLAPIQIVSCGKPVNLLDPNNAGILVTYSVQQDGAGPASTLKPFSGSAIPLPGSGGALLVSAPILPTLVPTMTEMSHEELVKTCNEIARVVEAVCYFIEPLAQHGTAQAACSALASILASTPQTAAFANAAMVACDAAVEAGETLCSAFAATPPGPPTIPDFPLVDNPSSNYTLPNSTKIICDAITAGSITTTPAHFEPSAVGNQGFTLTVHVFAPATMEGAATLTTVSQHVAAGTTSVLPITVDIGMAMAACNATITLADIGQPVIGPNSSTLGPDTAVIIPASLPAGASGSIPANKAVAHMPNGDEVPSLRYAYGGIWKIYRDKAGNTFIVVFNLDKSGNIVRDGLEPVIPRDGSLFTKGGLGGVLYQLPGGAALKADPNVFAISALAPDAPPTGSLQIKTAAGFYYLQQAGGTPPQVSTSTLLGFP